MVSNEIFSFYIIVFISIVVNVSFVIIVYLDSLGRKFVNLIFDYND